MVQALTHIATRTDPYENLAAEHLLMDAIAPHEQIMFLWQNTNTIVIGRNQDALRECRVEEFEGDGGRLARRLSGGGAVYHDIGNLNFTFISPRDSYDVARNMGIICEAVRSLGVEAELSGRNDIEVHGAKFSGNAFFKTKTACCHHGTLMVDVDTERLARYLHPDPRKLATRGVESVRSRVVNLHNLDSRITIGSLRDALLHSFSQSYDAPGPCALALEDRIAKEDLAREYERFSSDEWRLGKPHAFNRRYDHRFSWGGIDMQFTVQENRVRNATIYSDALDADFIDALAAELHGIAYDADAFKGCFESFARTNPTYKSMLADCHDGLIEELGERA